MSYDTILDVVGNTPVVRLHRIGRETGVELYAKCEFLNPAGSVKERIAVRMINELERNGKIAPAQRSLSPRAATPAPA